VNILFDGILMRYKVEKEYVINEHLSVRLINNKTVIYVDNRTFNQCKYLLLNLTEKDFDKFERIESIDDAFQVYNKLDKINEEQKLILDANTEFIGHCSNLQVWYENDYDLRILHSSLSFPLLKKLADLGDIKAINRLKEEIAERIVSKNSKSFLYYLNEEYLNFFTKEELECIFENWLDNNQRSLVGENIGIWLPLLKELAAIGIKKAEYVLKNEILRGVASPYLVKYKFCLTHEYLQFFSLEELEELYMSFPIKDYALLRPIHSLMIHQALKKRLKQIEENS